MAYKHTKNRNVMKETIKTEKRNEERQWYILNILFIYKTAEIITFKENGKPF